MRKHFLTIILLVISTIGCTDLVEKPFSEATPDTFFTTEKSIEPIIVGAYAPLRQYIWNYWNISECTADEMQSMFSEDGGSSQYIRLNTHLFHPNEGITTDFSLLDISLNCWFRHFDFLPDGMNEPFYE